MTAVSAVLRGELSKLANAVGDTGRFSAAADKSWTWPFLETQVGLEDDELVPGES